ncbi:MAG: prephenate dehydratase [Deltaproteobacteria bacterium]|nr:prephenate dehydratase [Deltaproteobacteria bacterium]MBW1736481.1 prephenate dehydratase [Deltaproteobacteria bacterium]MBW1909887.1 prephenate dehydratase [Deltaproteobacteria bacterium]MBW2032830.1 prephenate dehydratase [Deltaproteobacteria bacterium]MBW2113891.1 prephenate dehydratase [Deltaproteobacteria bacterium]
MDLKEIRKKIDHVDSKILRLLNNRMELVLMAKRFKSEIEDSKREKELFDRIRRNSTGLINAQFIEKIYVEIIKESKELQRKDYQLIAFQGEHGAYGEVAAREWNSNLMPMPCSEFSDVFEWVKSGLYDYGIVPVENTLGGVVGQVNQLLINSDLHVVGAVELSIHHCLLALQGTDHREIRTVYSHPQALAQCRYFLSRNKLEPVSFYDTSGAAKMLSEKGPKESAAIASKLSARLYELEIIKEDIEDLDRNMTRFLVLSKEENREEGNKCSIIFSTEHKAGTLFSVLEVFARANINLTRIESMPNEPGNYSFFLDFIGSNKDEKVVKALEQVKEITSNFKLMGCYKERKVV